MMKQRRQPYERRRRRRRRLHSMYHTHNHTWTKERERERECRTLEEDDVVMMEKPSWVKEEEKKT
jgi:hypothetical protein